MARTQHDAAPEITCGPSRFSRVDLLAVGLLMACLAGMFWRVLFTRAMFFVRDVYNYTYPSARLIHDLGRQGYLPYWNPYLNYGQPLLANPNLLFFYPFTLLIIALPSDIAYTLHFIVHFALGGLGVYLLARAWGQTQGGAFFAAFVFTFSGPVLSLGNIYNLAACAAWIPWALLVTHRALASRGPRPWVLLVVIFSLQWLAGEPMTMLATFGLCVAYAGFELIRGPGSKFENRNSKPEIPNSIPDSATHPRRVSNFEFRFSNPTLQRLLMMFFLVGVGAALLCAVQLLPATSVLSQSRRGALGLSFGETTTWSVNPFSLPEMMVPDFYGSGIGAPTGWQRLMSDSNLGPHYFSVFIGFVPFYFALAGWALARDRRRNFAAAAAAAFLLISFGHYTPVFALVYLLFPPFSMVRYPVKLLLLVTFLPAILAGWGFDALRLPVSAAEKRGRLLGPLMVFLGLILTILAVAWISPALIISLTRGMLNRLGETPFNLRQMPDFLVTMLRYELPGLVGFCLGGLILAYGRQQGKAWARPGLLAFAGLAIAQLMMVNYSANPTVPKSFYAYHPPVLREFKDPPGTYRVASFWPLNPASQTAGLDNYTNFDSIPEAGEFGPAAQGALQARLRLSTGAMLDQTEGNINLDLERSMPPYLYEVEFFQSREAAHPERVDCMLGRTNVKYLLRPRRADSSATRYLGDVFDGAQVPSALYEDLCFVPRVYVAGTSLFSTDSWATLDHLAAPDFDARHTVILAAAPGSAPGVGTPEGVPKTGIGQPSPPADSTPAGEVEIVHHDPNTLTLRAELTRPAYIVLLERYDPEWQASVDGHPARVLRANQIFRAVYAGAGQHEITFGYRQRGLKLGLSISLLTLGVLAALYFKR